VSFLLDPPLLCAGGGETCDSHIDADLASGGRQRIGRHIITREDQHPAPARPFDLNRLDSPRHRAVQLNFDLANAL
jgi:hypothetical protein